MTEHWRSGTRVVHAPLTSPLITVVVDDGDTATDLARLDPASLDHIEVRVAFAGPSRGSADALGELLVVVNQIALGAAGSGVWSSLEMLIGHVVRRRTTGKGARAGEQSDVRQSLTVMVPTEHGPALVHQEVIGPQDLHRAQLSVEQIVRSLVEASARRTSD